MQGEGFSIRCPHCFEWAQWAVHPKEYVIDPGQETQGIINGLMNHPNTFSHPKMLRCKSPVSECAAPFQAFVVKDQRSAHELVEHLPSWALRRAFRLYKRDHYERWEHYSAVLICTRHVVRQKHIELEQILDRELLSRASVGIAIELGAPVTVYAATVFETNNGPSRTWWIPVEAYSTGLEHVPPRYNLFCEMCRQAVIDGIVANFAGRVSPADCPVGLGLDGTCAGRVPACGNGDWSHCPAFLERRYELRLCYWCDRKLITRLETRWRTQQLEPQGYATHRCWAGFTEIAVPIEVHEHLVGVMMTGQFLLKGDRLATVSEIVNRLPSLHSHMNELERAMGLLHGCSTARTEQEQYTRAFCVDENRLREVITLAKSNEARLVRVAFTRYRQYRARSETAFKNELMGTLDRLTVSPDAEIDLLHTVLGRMREFWAFKAVYFLKWEKCNRKLWIRAFRSSCSNAPQVQESQVIGSIDMDFSQNHPLTWLYDADYHHIASTDPWARKFQDLFAAVTRDPTLGVPQGPYYFLVAVPFGDNIYAFVFAVRDEESVSPLRPLQKGGISELCQEAILDTCIGVVRRLGEFWYKQERAAIAEAERLRLLSGILNGLMHDLGPPIERVDVALRKKFPSGPLSNEPGLSGDCVGSRDAETCYLLRKELHILADFTLMGVYAYQFAPVRSPSGEFLGLEESLIQSVRKHTSPFAIEPLIRRCVAVLEICMRQDDQPENHPRIVIECPPEYRITAFYEGMMVPLYNLIKNAWQYADPDKLLQSKIEISVARDDKYTIITIADRNPPPAKDITRSLSEFGSDNLGLSLSGLFTRAHPGRARGERGELSYNRVGGKNVFTIEVRG